MAALDFPKPFLGAYEIDLRSPTETIRDEIDASFVCTPKPFLVGEKSMLDKIITISLVFGIIAVSTFLTIFIINHFTKRNKVTIIKDRRKVETIEFHIGTVVLEKGDQNLKQALYDVLATSTCGKCGASPIYKGPSAGLSMNLICKECEQRFWIGPHREWGAYFL